MKRIIKYLIVITVMLLPFGHCYADNDNLSSQINATQKLNYITSITKYAEQASDKYHILPSLMIAHSALESNYGTSKLSFKYNNYFGIKAKVGQPHVTLPTKEYQNGQYITVNAKFAKFQDKQACFDYYAKLLSHSNRYNNVAHQSNYQTAAINLSKDGYATDPDLAQKIIKIDNFYHLFRLDPK